MFVKHIDSTGGGNSQCGENAFSLLLISGSIRAYKFADFAAIVYYSFSWIFLISLLCENVSTIAIQNYNLYSPTYQKPPLQRRCICLEQKLKCGNYGLTAIEEGMYHRRAVTADFVEL